VTAAAVLLPGAEVLRCARVEALGRGFRPAGTSRASTGRHTGRAQNGRCTTIPATTKQVPKDSLFREGDDPSYCQPAPCTFRPDRRNSESSTATVSAAPAGTSSMTASRATARPSSSASQRARAKK
jgi:hypothetical protein